MTTLASLRRSCACLRCGQELVAPDRSLYVTEEQAHHFWVCSKCGYQFETFSNLKASLLPAVMETHLPTLLVA